jgi:hypothetical protein
MESTNEQTTPANSALLFSFSIKTPFFGGPAPNGKQSFRSALKLE